MTLEQVEKLRDQLVTQFFMNRYNVTCDAGVVHDWAGDLAKLLKVERTPVFDSLLHLSGKVLLPEEAFRIAWRLAGGLELLRDGRGVPPWSRQNRPETVLIKLETYERKTDASHRAVAHYSGRIYTGSPAGEIGVCDWPMRMIAMIARRVGYTRISGKYPMRDPAEFVGLRLSVDVEFRSGEAKPYFSTIHESASLANWNRKHVMCVRLRKQPCPRSLPNYCHQCRFGTDQCPYATHPKTIEESVHADGERGSDAAQGG